MNLMEFVLEKLNEEHPYFFGADIYMRLATREMKYAIIDSDYLSVDEEERIPIGEMQTMETPYVEKNGKTDYTVIYACLLKMPKRDGEPFDVNSDAYQALKSFKAKVNGKRFDIDGKEYAFKATHFHPRGDVFQINSADYRMLEIQLTYTVLEIGSFLNSDTCPIFIKKTNDSTWHKLDYLEVSVPMGTETHTTSDVRTNDNSTDKVIRYAMTFSLIVNYQGGDVENALYASMLGDKDQINQKYNLKIEHVSGNYEYLVQPIAGSPIFRPNTTDKISLDLKEVTADVE